MINYQRISNGVIHGSTNGVHIFCSSDAILIFKSKEYQETQHPITCKRCQKSAQYRELLRMLTPDHRKTSRTEIHLKAGIPILPAPTRVELDTLPSCEECIEEDCLHCPTKEFYSYAPEPPTPDHLINKRLKKRPWNDVMEWL